MTDFCKKLFLTEKALNGPIWNSALKQGRALLFFEQPQFLFMSQILQHVGNIQITDFAGTQIL